MASISFTRGSNRTFKSDGNHFSAVTTKTSPQENPGNHRKSSHKKKSTIESSSKESSQSWIHLESQISALRKIVENVVSRHEGPVVRGMVSFCRHEAKIRNEEETPDLMSCASFSLGASPWSQDRILKQLEKEMKEPKIIVPLNSSTFSNIRRAVSVTIGKCIAQLESGSSNTAHFQDNRIEEESPELTCGSTFGDLVDVYEQRGLSKRREIAPAILLVFEDTEAFPRSILSQFIQICAINYDRLPLIPLFGFRSSDAALPNVLSAEITGLLNVTSFRIPGPEQYLDSLLKPCLYGFPWKIDPKLLQYLISRTLDDYGSAQQFLIPLELALFRQAIDEPAFVLCQDGDELEEVIGSCSESVISRVFELPSVLSSEPTGLKEGKACAMKILKEARKYLGDFSLSLQLLSTLLTGMSFDPPLHELYCTVLERGFSDEELSTAVSAWRYWDTETSQRKISESIQVLKMTEVKEAEDTAVEMICNLEEFQNRFDNIDEVQQKFDETQTKEAGRAFLSESLKGTNKRPTRSQVQDELKKRIQSKKTDPLNELRSDFIRYLTQTLKSHLAPPAIASADQKPIPGYELFFLPWSKECEKWIETNHRDNFHRTIAPPPETIDSNSPEPDASIAYRLYKTCPIKTMDISDWLTRFKEEVKEQIKTPKPTKTSKKSSSKVESRAADLDGRFFVALAELELNGIIKGSDTKQGVVQRLYGVGMEESEFAETGLIALDTSS